MSLKKHHPSAFEAAGCFAATVKKHLKTAFALLAFGTDQDYEENNITTDIGIMLRHF